jgi:hypothetical protein
VYVSRLIDHTVNSKPSSYSPVELAADVERLDAVRLQISGTEIILATPMIRARFEILNPRKDEREIACTLDALEWREPYRILSMSKDRIMLRPEQGWHPGDSLRHYWWRRLST